jgi:preprotein translocase subunit SecY
MSGIVGLFRNPELRKRIFFSLTMLAVYRIGSHVPMPGVNSAALKETLGTTGFFKWLNFFDGGALERFSIFALGVIPYISCSIIFQFLSMTWPYLQDLQKEGEQGRRKINQYTRYAAVALALIQGFGMATTLEFVGQGPSIVLDPGMTFRILTAMTICAGTIFLMWVGEQITERGIGNGISLIIFAGIATRIPQGVSSTLGLYKSGELSLFKLFALASFIILTFYCIIFVERGNRRIPIHYAKRVIGRKVYGGQNTNIPLKLNTAGVIPPIFAQALIMFPGTLVTFIPIQKLKDAVAVIQSGGLLYNVIFLGLIIFFCYFYTAVTFKTDDVADNLKKYGGFVPGIRPGQATAQYIDYILTRITLGGAVYISLICVLPTVLSQGLKTSFYFGGTSVLILVGVALDTVAQIETFLISKNYDGFMKHTRIRGRTSSS